MNIELDYELDFEYKLKFDIHVELEVQTEVIGIPLDKLSACQSTRFPVQCGTCGSKIDQDLTGI